MNWIEIKIITETPALEILCAMLTDYGVKGFVTQDKESFQEFLNDKTGKWDYIEESLMSLSECDTSITFYLPDDAQGAEQFASIKNLLENLKLREDAAFFGSLALSCNNVKEDDWANNWKQFFKPFPVGEKLYIKPSWETIPEETSRTVLEIDPASSFGTGQHHTTRLCLELSETVLKPNDKILDLGCGSGILSIGAMLLGAASATAVDIVENSVKTALENAQKNHISPEVYHTYCGDICSDTDLRNTIGSGYDLIYANIVADVLIAMSSLFKGFLKPSGHLIVSGIIIERADEVLDTLKEKGFEVLTVKEKEGWAAALLKVKA
ncbi:MAG: 50S ribosomal protein L11 methyltransferase [Oscillospiraceae bacterium]|nr:50S ribosomal protein L11 methyltransferase [Oscillospiraceae bacterium]MBR7083939.1 50S ribosomal protein L11 methyltransferase [Oscillospiraceae bacterium]